MKPDYFSAEVSTRDELHEVIDVSLRNLILTGSLCGSLFAMAMVSAAILPAIMAIGFTMVFSILGLWTGFLPLAWGLRLHELTNRPAETNPMLVGKPALKPDELLHRQRGAIER